jgi:PPIC-type peptidyl-prolyl cis-trans isomerase-like protein
MRSPSLILVLFLGSIVCLGGSVVAQEGEAPKDGKNAAQEEKAKGSGRIRGRVIWDGIPFEARPVLWPKGLLDRDPALATMAREREIVDRRLVVDKESKGIAACIVTLPALRLPLPAPKRMELVIQDLAFATRAVVLPEGWSLLLKNEDPVKHRFELRRGAEVLQRFEVEPRSTHELGHVVGGDHVLISVDLPFLGARIIPRARTPRIVTDVRGAFDIRGAPAGKHVVQIRHELLGSLRREIEVAPGETLEIQVSQRDFRRPGTEGGLRVFAESGPAVMEVDGLGVSEATIARFAAFFGRRHAGLVVPEKLRREQALRRAVLPVAAVWSRRQADRERLRPRVEEILTLLATGQDFAGIAEKLSDEPAEQRGQAREAYPRDLDPVLGAALFSAPLGQIQGPIASARGLHFLLVEEVRAAEDLAEERRKFRHLVLVWEEGADRAKLDGLAAEAVARARVRVKDGKLAELLPPELLR